MRRFVLVVLLACSCGDDSNPRDLGLPDAHPTEPGYLWYAGAGLSAFQKRQLAQTNANGPGLALVPALEVKFFHDLAFDTDGNLWTIPISGDQVVRLPAGELAVGMVPVPDLVITSSALAGPQSLAFDAAGNLWVLNYHGAAESVATVIRFDDPRALSGPQQLSPSATIAPSNDPAAKQWFTQGTSIAFDRDGNLWFAGVQDLVRIDSPAHLSGDVVAAPSAIISTGEAYAAIAFDAAGALWVTAAQSGYIALRFDQPATLAGTVSPTPAARVALPSDKPLFAGGMAFDDDGALWIAMSDRILKLSSPGSLTGSVNADPAVVLMLPLHPDVASKLVIRP
jgi:sugar lactone lactonase YvrE